jgi:hypothetical protein
MLNNLQNKGNFEQHMKVVLHSNLSTTWEGNAVLT